MSKPKLGVEKRKILGRKVKALRKEGVLPANIYGKKIKSLAVQLKTADFQKVFKEVGETGLVELVVNGSKKPVLIHNVQFDPVSSEPLHADFLQVDLKEKVTARIPLELIGESPAEKQGLGTVVQYIDEIEVEALPSDLLDKFEIDGGKLAEVDQTILVKDLDYDKKKIEIKEDPEIILVKVEPPREEEEEVPAEEAPTEGESEEAKEEGKVEAEGKEEAEEQKSTSEESPSEKN